jgi:hypothetical protein
LSLAEGSDASNPPAAVWGRYGECLDKTPKDLAKRLGVSDRTIRAYLRERYRPDGKDKYSRWKLDEGMVADVVRRFED